MNQPNRIPFAAVPTCLMKLAEERRWVGWRWEQRADKHGAVKDTKPPRNVRDGVDAGYAKNDDRSTWATRAEAEAVLAAGQVQGIGLQPLDLVRFAAIDLDDVRDEDGSLKPWAEEAIARSKSYAELTPSGTGARIIGRVPPDHGSIHRKITHPEGGAFEVYANLTTGRYITVTGQRIEGAPEEATDISAVIAELMLLKDKTPPRTAIDASAEVLRTHFDVPPRPAIDIGPTIGDPPRRPAIDTGGSSTGCLPQWLQDTISHGASGDRAADFQSAVNGLSGWMTFEQALTLFERHPDGPASKYIAENRLEAELRRSWDKAEATCVRSGPGSNVPTPDDPHAAEPIDLWGKFTQPPLPRGLLPPVIERFAFAQAEQMGADPAGLAAAALCVACAAIPDKIKVRVQQHGTWSEAPRTWVALVGPPSTRKSPIMDAAEKPLRKLDRALCRDYIRSKAEFDALPKAEKAAAERPRHLRLRLDDTTIEAAAEVLGDSPNGVLLSQDELSGWFSGMDRYGNGKGADRAFWLRAYNGGDFAFTRIGRGAGFVENLSVCVLGGIQPEPMRKVVAGSADDGLLQRLLPVVLRPATIPRDDAQTAEAMHAYETLIGQLTKFEIVPAARFIDMGERPHLVFEAGAQQVRRQLEHKHHEIIASIETFNRKLAAHIGKYDGTFARLCVAFHVIENVGTGAKVITEDIARRVGDFMHRFLLPHAFAFYSGVLDLSDDHDCLTDIAGFILARKLETISARDVARGSGSMRGLTRPEVLRLFEQLEALAWVSPQPSAPRSNASPTWDVNPRVHSLFEVRAAEEAERRRKAREHIQELTKWRA